MQKFLNLPCSPDISDFQVIFENGTIFSEVVLDAISQRGLEAELTIHHFTIMMLSKWDTGLILINQEHFTEKSKVCPDLWPKICKSGLKEL